MVTRSQPRGARGTHGHPYSALNLRLALAVFGFAISVLLAVLLARAGLALPAVIFGVLAVVAVVDLVVVQRRRAARRREEPGVRHTLFE